MCALWPEPGLGHRWSPGRGYSGRLGGGVSEGGAGRRRLEEDATPLRCHRRVAGKQLVPAPFRPAPLATRNTMHNNQARAWSRATRRGRGGAAGGAGAPGSRPPTGVRRPQASPGRVPPGAAALRPGILAPPVSPPLASPSLSAFALPTKFIPTNSFPGHFPLTSDNPGPLILPVITPLH